MSASLRGLRPAGELLRPRFAPSDLRRVSQPLRPPIRSAASSPRSTTSGSSTATAPRSRPRARRRRTRRRPRAGGRRRRRGRASAPRTRRRPGWRAAGPRPGERPTMRAISSKGTAEHVVQDERQPLGRRRACRARPAAPGRPSPPAPPRAPGRPPSGADDRVGHVRVQRLLAPRAARAQHVQAHPRDDRGQPAAQVLDVARRPRGSAAARPPAPRRRPR